MNINDLENLEISDDDRKEFVVQIFDGGNTFHRIIADKFCKRNHYSVLEPVNYVGAATFTPNTKPRKEMPQRPAEFTTKDMPALES